MVRNTFIACAVWAGLATGAAAQGTPTPTPGVPTYRPAVDATRAFPDAARATVREGQPVPPQTVAMVVPGMTKRQIYPLLGPPHFSEGLFGVRRWNYVLHFYTGSGTEQVSCQYQIGFDAKARVSGAWFRDQACADLFARALDGAASKS